MARRGTKKIKRRRSRGENLTLLLESFIQTDILFRGTTGGGIWAFFTGATDLGMADNGGIKAGTIMGAGHISLGDVMQNPSLAVDTVWQNARSNLIPMAVASVTTRIGFRLFNKLMSPNRRAANRLINATVGKGVAHF